VSPSRCMALGDVSEYAPPPCDGDLVVATIINVDTEEFCGRTSKSFSEVDGLEIRLADGSSHHVHAHAVFSPGDEVKAFQDSDGDCQVKGSFTKGWAARTVGATGVGAFAFFVIAGASQRPRKLGGSANVSQS
jgi:hypothetical protein